MKGFGWASRDTGHSRVPLPPERIRGISMESKPNVGELGAVEHGDHEASARIQAAIMPLKTPRLSR